MKTLFRRFAASAVAALLALASTGPALAQGYAAGPTPQRFALSCYDASGAQIEGLVIDFGAGVGFSTPDSAAEFAQPIRVSPSIVVVPVRTPRENYDLVLFRIQGQLSRQEPSGQPAFRGYCTLTGEFVAAWMQAVRSGRGHTFP